MRANEFAKNELVIFDIDDTLFHTTAMITVRDADDAVVEKLTNKEFNNYKLEPGQYYDFGEFKDARKFEEESIPIGPMLDQLRLDLSQGKRVVMLTARGDFNDQPTIWRTFKRHGIDINKDVHLYRAENWPSSEPPAYKKARFIRVWLDRHLYDVVTLYDDSERNLSVFKSLKKEYPTIKFIAYHVTEKGQTRQIEGYNLAGFSGSTAVIGDDNWISPVGSVKKFQLNSKNTEQY